MESGREGDEDAARALEELLRGSGESQECALGWLVRGSEGGAQPWGLALAASLQPRVAASGRKQQHICGSH